MAEQGSQVEENRVNTSSGASERLPQSEPGRRDYLLGLILAAAFLFRLGYGAVVGLETPPTGRSFLIDEQEYYAAAQMLAAGHGFAFYDTFAWARAPLYPLLVALVFRVAGVTPGLVLAVQAVLSTLTLYWLATLAGRATGGGRLLSARAARRSAALIGAAWLPFTLFSQLLVSETLFLCLFVAALVVLARWSDRRDVSNRPARESWLLLGGAGALLGLAALTRSTALAFLPLAAGWIVWCGAGAKQFRNNKNLFHKFLLLFPFFAGAALVIAPWTARNIAAYGISPGGPVIIDTSSGYNLWLAANGVRDGERLAKELQGIDGVLARQQHALAQAQEQIAADPGAFLAKGWKEVGDLWTINFTAEERQVRGFTAGRVPAAHLLALALLEDGLYLLLVPLALLGLAVAPPDPLKALVGLWAGLWVVMAFVFFAVTRFRFPVVACLLPWVPVGLAWLAGRGWRTVPLRGGRWAPIGLAGLWVLVVGPSAAVAAENTALGVARWGDQAPFREGDYARANQQIADTRFAILANQIDKIHLKPDPQAQLNEIARSPYLDIGPSGIYNTRYEPYLLLGQIARLQGDPARAAPLFTNRAVNDATPEALAWAAAHLRVVGLGRQVDVGSGLDTGFVQGMYPPEREGDRTYRWTTGEAVLEPDRSGMSRLCVRWNGWRPAGWPPATVTAVLKYSAFSGTDQRVITLPNDTLWHEADIQSLTEDSSLLRVILHTSTFVPGGYDPRSLGIRIDQLAWADNLDGDCSF